MSVAILNLESILSQLMLPFLTLSHSFRLQHLHNNCFLLFLYPVPSTGVQKVPLSKSLLICSQRPQMFPPTLLPVVPRSSAKDPPHLQHSYSHAYDLSITLQKGKHSITTRLISKFLSYDKPSPQFCSLLFLHLSFLYLGYFRRLCQSLSSRKLWMRRCKLQSLMKSEIWIVHLVIYITQNPVFYNHSKNIEVD